MVNIYMYLTKIYELLRKNGWVCIENIHIHNDSTDYARVSKIKIKDDGRIIKTVSLSGGRQEAVWNTYEQECDSFIKAFTDIIDINDIHKLADAIYCVYSFEERWRRISFEELCELDKELSKYCNSRL